MLLIRALLLLGSIFGPSFVLDRPKPKQDDDIVPGLFSDGAWSAARGFGRGPAAAVATGGRWTSEWPWALS